MKQLIYFLLLSTPALMMAGCGGSNFFSFPGVHKMDIQQGNVFTEKEVSQLKLGMSKEQVEFIMGSPVLSNIFNKDRWDYIYSFQLGSENRQQKKVTLVFNKNKLVNMTGDYLAHQHPGKTDHHLSKTGHHLSKTDHHLSKTGHHLSKTDHHLSKTGHHLNKTDKQPAKK